MIKHKLLHKTIVLILVATFSFSCVGLSLGNPFFTVVHNESGQLTNSCPMSEDVFSLLDYNQAGLIGGIFSSLFLFFLLSWSKGGSNSLQVVRTWQVNTRHKIVRLFNYFVDLFRKGIVQSDGW